MEIEIKDSFINIISSAMESLLGPNRKDFKVTNAKEIGFEPITYFLWNSQSFLPNDNNNIFCSRSNFFILAY